jgi:hypothetical protein
VTLAQTGSVIQNNSKTLGTTIALTVATGNLPAAGELLVVCLALDNLATTDQDENLVSGIADSGGNVYTKVAEWTNSRGAAAGGAVCSVWYSVITTSLTNAQTITATHGSITARAMQAFRHTRDTAKTITVKGFQHDVWTAVNPPATTALTLTNGTQYLVIHAMANELATASAFTPATNYTAWSAATYGTTSGTTTNESLAVEYRIASTLTSEAPDASVTAADGAGIITAFYEVAAAAGKLPSPPKSFAAVQQASNW